MNQLETKWKLTCSYLVLILKYLCDCSNNIVARIWTNYLPSLPRAHPNKVNHSLSDFISYYVSDSPSSSLSHLTSHLVPPFPPRPPLALTPLTLCPILAFSLG